MSSEQQWNPRSDDVEGKHAERRERSSAAGRDMTCTNESLGRLRQGLVYSRDERTASRGWIGNVSIGDESCSLPGNGDCGVMEVLRMGGLRLKGQEGWTIIPWCVCIPSELGMPTIMLCSWFRIEKEIYSRIEILEIPEFS